MKKVINALMLCTLVLTAASSYGQLRKIPAEVTDNFAEMFPDATGVEWRDRLSGFSATFSVDSVSYTASFNNDGEWESTEHKIEEEELPAAVIDGFKKSKYADWNLSDVIHIELPDEAVQYRLVVAKGDIKKRNLYFNTEGRMLKDKLTL